MLSSYTGPALAHTVRARGYVVEDRGRRVPHVGDMSSVYESGILKKKTKKRISRASS